MQRYKVEVLEVHSGDDLVLMVDLGVEGLYKKVRARLFGIDTPDAHKETPDTEAGKVRDLVRRLTLNVECMVDVNSSSGKGGWKVTLYRVPAKGSPESINEVLRSQGYVFKRETGEIQ